MARNAAQSPTPTKNAAVDMIQGESDELSRQDVDGAPIPADAARELWMRGI
jgi:hypothetical protein